MRSGRSALSVMAGVLLGLGVVVLAGSGLNAQWTQATPVQPSSNWTNGTSQSVTTTNTGGASVTVSGSGTTFSPMVRAPSLSQVGSLARQPITLIGLVLLPVLAAFLFGLVLYKVPGMRHKEEEHLEAA